MAKSQEEERTTFERRLVEFAGRLEGLGVSYESGNRERDYCESKS